MLAYLDHLERRGELDLEVATEFLVLIAALLELKSRLMLPRDEDEPLDDSSPPRRPRSCSRGCSSARRYRGAADHLRERLAAEDGMRYRSAPLPPELRRVAARGRRQAVYDPRRARRGARRAAARAAAARPAPHRACRAVTRRRAPGAPARAAAPRRASRFDEAVRGADRVTVAVTLFALLELYKQGEATWEQDEPFGEITVQRRDREAARSRGRGP